LAGVTVVPIFSRSLRGQSVSALGRDVSIHFLSSARPTRASGPFFHLSCVDSGNRLFHYCFVFNPRRLQRGTGFLCVSARCMVSHPRNERGTASLSPLPRAPAFPGVECCCVGFCASGCATCRGCSDCCRPLDRGSF